MTDPALEVLPLALDDTWAYGPGILHGGFLLELLAGHAVTEAHPHPLATTAHFLAAPRVGAAEVHRTRLRTGRSAAVTRVALVQEGRTCLDAVVTAGRLSDDPAVAYDDAPPPVLPPLEECVVSASLLEGERNGIVENLEQRLDPATTGWLDGQPRERALVQGWLRSATGREVDPLFLLCLADGLPPVPFALGMRGWVPTVSMTVYVRALPAPGWVRAVQQARVIADGWLDEDCLLYDSTGRLVAQATQLAGYRPAPA